LHNPRKAQDAEFFKAIRDREAAREEQETDGQADATSAHELTKFPAFALSPFIEVVADSVLDCLGALSRWSGGEVDQQFQLMIWRQFARPAHDEFFRVSIEIAVNERRRVQRVEKLREFAQAKTDDFWVLAGGVRRGHDSSLTFTGVGFNGSAARRRFATAFCWLPKNAADGIRLISMQLVGNIAYCPRAFSAKDLLIWPMKTTDLASHAKDVAEALTALETDSRRGLSEAQARERLATQGRNELTAKAPVPVWRKILAQFADVLVLLLIAAAAISAVIWWFERGSTLPYEALAIFAIVMLNAVMGYMQQASADQSIHHPITKSKS